MGMIEYLIIAAGIGGVMLIILTTKKKTKKTKPAKSIEKPAETQKQETPTQKESPSFKIVKKSRLSRVSKKALQTNARTATVEKVFERTLPMPTEENKNVYIDPLEPSHEELLRQLENIEAPSRKVVSLKDLKQELTAQEHFEQEEYSSLRVPSRTLRSNLPSVVMCMLGIQYPLQ